MNKSLLAGMMMLIVGLLLFFVLIPYGIDSPKKIRYSALSPLYYPKIVAVALSIIGAAIMVKSWRKTEPETLEPQHPNGKVRVLSFLLILAIYATTLDFLGFVASGTMILTASLLLAGERRVTVIAPVCLGLPIMLHLFFYKIANVPIPAGILAPLLEGL
jgi:putative tricarboxylic transport membrane protein